MIEFRTPFLEWDNFIWSSLSDLCFLRFFHRSKAFMTMGLGFDFIVYRYMPGLVFARGCWSWTWVLDQLLWNYLFCVPGCGDLSCCRHCSFQGPVSCCDTLLLLSLPFGDSLFCLPICLAASRCLWYCSSSILVFRWPCIPLVDSYFVGSRWLTWYLFYPVCFGFLCASDCRTWIVSCLEFFWSPVSWRSLLLLPLTFLFSGIPVCVRCYESYDGSAVLRWSCSLSLHFFFSFSDSVP